MSQISVGKVNQIAVVVPPGACLASIGALVDSVRLMRRYIHRQYGAVDALPAAERFGFAEVRLLGIESGRSLTVEGIAISLSGKAVDSAVHDVVAITDFVPHDDAPEEVADDFAYWLRRQAEGGAVIAASGAAVALVAGAGLLDGRQATAPWWMVEQLRSRFPQVNFTPDEAVTADGRLLCSAGSATDHLLAVRVMERASSRNSARWLARHLLLQDGAWSPSLIMREDDTLLARAQQWLTEHMSRPVTVQELADTMQVSRRTLHRHFLKGAGIPPLAWLQMLRIEAAKSMLDRTTFTIERISGLVGYSDVSFFRQTFRRATDRSPARWRKDMKAARRAR
jgi:transcriptional regulator GlxA family with amidase domain